MLKNKIIDCFIFYNELEMLEYRLNNSEADYFVIVESTHTFMGNPKKLYFDKSLYTKFNIIYVLVDDMPFKNVDVSKNEQWKNEKFQRNCISLGLDQIKLNDNDIIILADVDEIPDYNTIKSNSFNFEIGQLEQDFYYYNLNSKIKYKWYYSKVLLYSFYKLTNLSLDDIRNTLFPIIPKGGWHLSYFGNPEFISNKIKNFSHQEYNNIAFTDLKLIEERVTKQLDLFNRSIDEIENVTNELYLPPNCDFFKVKIKNYCFIHSCNIKGTQTLKYLLDKIKNVTFEKIFINNIGPPIEEIFDNCEITNFSLDHLLFEIPTINLVRDFSIKNKNCNILYLHTKGITHNKPCVQDWIDMMLYFLIKPQNHLYDTSGCNYHDGTKYPKHYSGNFWWAKTDYLATLPECIGQKFEAEFWLHQGNPKYQVLHNSGINHYDERYPIEKLI